MSQPIWSSIITHGCLANKFKCLTAKNPLEMHFINYIDLQTNEVTHREKKKKNLVSAPPCFLPNTLAISLKIFSPSSLHLWISSSFQALALRDGAPFSATQPERDTHLLLNRSPQMRPANSLSNTWSYTWAMLVQQRNGTLKLCCPSVRLARMQ